MQLLLTNMNRETKTLQTPEGKELIIKSFLSARERNQIRNVYLSGMKIDMGAGGQVKEMDGSLLETAEKKLIEVTIVSYDGGSENVLDMLLDSAPSEYDFVVAEATKLNSSLGGAK